MKRFLIKTFVLACVIYVLAWELDYIISKGQEKISGYPQQSWTEIRYANLQCDGVILGTSRGLEHYDPYVIDSITGHSFYNLGMGGYQINANLMKLRCYCRHNPQPKYIIYDVDHIVMHTCSCKHNHQSEQYLPLIYDKDMRHELRQVGYSLADVYFPLVRYWGYLTHIKRGIFDFFHIKHHTEFVSYHGHTPDPDSWSIDNLHFTDTVKAELQPEAKAIFEEFVQDCQNKGIKVILSTSPRHKGLTEITTGHEEEMHYFDSIAEVYHLPYLKFIDDYWMCNDSSLFNAGVHLTPAGTKIFSKEFAKELVKQQCLE